MLIELFAGLFVFNQQPDLTYVDIHNNITDAPVIHEITINNKISKHYGGKQLDHHDITYTINSVLNDFENFSNKELIGKLVYETMIVETRVGKLKYDYSAKNYNNFGIAQVRTDTAEDLKQFLQKKNSKMYNVLMKYRDNNLSERDNLLYNVEYSIAVCANYYWRRDREIESKINSLEDRAFAWKKYYNTYKGVGSVEVYQKRVNEHFASL